MLRVKPPARKPAAASPADDDDADSECHASGGEEAGDSEGVEELPHCIKDPFGDAGPADVISDVPTDEDSAGSLDEFVVGDNPNGESGEEDDSCDEAPNPRIDLCASNIIGGSPRAPRTLRARRARRPPTPSPLASDDDGDDEGEQDDSDDEEASFRLGSSDGESSTDDEESSGSSSDEGDSDEEEEEEGGGGDAEALEEGEIAEVDPAPQQKKRKAEADAEAPAPRPKKKTLFAQTPECLL